MVFTYKSVALDLGEKQSSPILTQARSTLTCSTLSESKKSEFLGRAVALLDSAVQATSLKEMCFEVTKKVVQQGESLK